MDQNPEQHLGNWEKCIFDPTYQVTVCSLTRSQVIHIHSKCKKDRTEAVPGTLIMNLALKYFVLFRAWQAHMISHHSEFSALAYILRSFSCQGEL